MKGIDFVIRKTALELNIPEDKAKIVIMEYWSVIYKKLLAGSHSALTVRHVGTFAMSRYKINIAIHKRINRIQSLKKTDKLTEERKEEIREMEYKKLRLVLKHRNDIAKQYAKQFGNI